MATHRDYYKTLGIPVIATQEDIRKAYRTLSKKYHPDLNPDLKLYSDDKMKELVEAYTILNDPDKRKEYDAQPQFHIRRSRRGSARRPIDYDQFTKKPSYKAEPSILERILSPFFRKKSDKEHLIQYDPKQADVHFTLGVSMSDNERFFEQAKNEFRVSLKFDNDHIDSLYNYALMSYKLGEFEESVINFQKVLTMDKNDVQARKMITLLREGI